MCKLLDEFWEKERNTARNAVGDIIGNKYWLRFAENLKFLLRRRSESWKRSLAFQMQMCRKKWNCTGECSYGKQNWFCLPCKIRNKRKTDFNIFVLHIPTLYDIVDIQKEVESFALSGSPQSEVHFQAVRHRFNFKNEIVAEPVNVQAV